MIKKMVCVLLICVIFVVVCACTSEKQVNNTQDSDNSSSIAQGSEQVENDSNTASDTTLSEETASVQKYETLKLGDEGEAVSALQNRLIELNYLRGEANGKFDAKTQKAVELFKKLNGLKVTPKAGEKSQSVLFSDSAIARELPLQGYIIGIDPGHQEKANYEEELRAPWLSDVNKKVASGTAGIKSGTPEYKVVLIVGLKLRDLLEAQGATVIMTRETNDVNISNIERAQIFNNAKTDYAIRLHCEGTEEYDTSRHGAFMLVPYKDPNLAKRNPYLDDCLLAAEILIDEYCNETGAFKGIKANKGTYHEDGITIRNDQTGFNWCERMIINIEMGHMSNAEEDEKLTNKEYQEKMAVGLLKGILKYYETVETLDISDVSADSGTVTD